MNTAVRVVARLVSKPDKAEELKAILLTLIAPTRKEAGCKSYDLLQNNSDPTDFTFVEEWESAAALEAHMLALRASGTLGKAADLLGGAPDIRKYTAVS